MENKLQQLTEKLYNEGLSKGRNEAESLVEQAKNESKKIIADAHKQAEQILADTRKHSEELRSNTQNEIRMASAQMVSALRQQVEKMIVTEVISFKVSDSWKDSSFIKDLMVEAVKSWNPACEENALQIIVPSGKDKEFDQQVKSAVGQKLASNVEMITDSRIKVPFRIAPASGGYYLSFTDVDFETLFKAYLRPKVSKLLFGENE